METGRVIGVLTGGYASCDDPGQPDYYGRLSAVSSLYIVLHAAAI